jgi:t-SNARE complex subunit (syntaxin)
MSSQEPLIALLTEIRDLQREQLELYRKQSEQAGAHLQQSLTRQTQALDAIERLRKRLPLVIVCVAAIVIALVVLRLLPN